MTATKREVCIAVVALVFVLLALRLWQVAREASIRAASTAAAQQQIITEKDQEMKERDALNKVATASLLQQAAAVSAPKATPQQAAKVIVQYMPQSAQTPIVSVAKADLPAAVIAQLPDAPSYELLTAAQTKQIAADELTCDATRHDLSTCAADAADLRAQLAAEKLETEAWRTAAKGGTRWHRFIRTAEQIACATGGAGLGQLISRSGPVGPAVGAAAGVTACSFIP